MPNTHPKTPLRKGFLRSFVRWLITGVVLIWALAALMLAAARWIDPPTTAVHVQRRLQAWIRHTPYHERYKFIPLSQISPDLQHYTSDNANHRALAPRPTQLIVGVSVAVLSSTSITSIGAVAVVTTLKITC
jgi:hypothetical protein